MSKHETSANSLRTGGGYTASFEVSDSPLEGKHDVLSEEDRMQLGDSLTIHEELYLRLGQ